MLKAVIFDLDGTIADTIPLTIVALRSVAEHYTGKVLSDEEILKEFGPTDTDIALKLACNEKAAEQLYIDNFRENFELYIKPVDGIEDLLKYLKERGIKIGLFTGRGYKVTEIILEKLNIRHFFDSVIAGEETLKHKPDPEGIIMSLDRLQILNHEGAYVGDYGVDILASKAAGTKAVLALWASSGNYELIKLNPDAYFENVKDFISWVDKAS